MTADAVAYLLVENIVKNGLDAQAGNTELTLTLEANLHRLDGSEVPLVGVQYPIGYHMQQITVTDGGCGIGPETMQRMFDIGFTTKPHHEGVGLGIVPYILEYLCGFVRVQSEVGKGTKFSVYLPAEHPIIPKDQR